MGAESSGKQWREEFSVDKKNLGPTGRNSHFVLEAGYRLHFRGGGMTSTWSILAETKEIDGVVTRVVEDREEKNGKLVESTRDYFAIDSATGDLYYFGEEASSYKAGKVSHAGSWLSGVNGARFGLLLPGKVTPGDRFMQERAPRDGAMDRSEVVAVGETVKTPAGEFAGCVHLRDSSAVEKGGDDKWYAPGLGLVRDGKMVLVGVEKP